MMMMLEESEPRDGGTLGRSSKYLCLLLSNPLPASSRILQFSPDDDIGEPRKTENVRGP